MLVKTLVLKESDSDRSVRSESSRIRSFKAFVFATCQPQAFKDKMPSLVSWPVYILILKLYFVKHDALEV